MDHMSMIKYDVLFSHNRFIVDQYLLIIKTIYLKITKISIIENHYLFCINNKNAECLHKARTVSKLTLFFFVA